MRALALCLLLSGCGVGDGPELEAISPEAGQAGDRVVLTGARFCGADTIVDDEGSCDPLPVGYVSFGIDPQIDGSVVSWRDGRIEVVVPTNASGSVLVVLTVDGRSSNGVSFEVQP